MRRVVGGLLTVTKTVQPSGHLGLGVTTPAITMLAKARRQHLPKRDGRAAWLKLLKHVREVVRCISFQIDKMDNITTLKRPSVAVSNPYVIYETSVAAAVGKNYCRVIGTAGYAAVRRRDARIERQYNVVTFSPANQHAMQPQLNHCRPRCTASGS
jgi:hypothetical protein